VILAGGNGTRLQSLTLKIAGDSRPKQFCPIIGGETLLSQTRARIDSLFNTDRQLFIVTREHETYYREELRNVDDSGIIAQPLNRGTGIGRIFATAEDCDSSLLDELQTEQEGNSLYFRET
jgi:mannose-1-phosphate guanylyltransferase